MIALLLLCAQPSLEDNWARFQKAVDAQIAKDEKAVQALIDDLREKLKRATSADRAKELRDTIAEIERKRKLRADKKYRPKILYLDHLKLKAGQIGAFDDDNDNFRLVVTVVEIIDKTTFIARKRWAGENLLYYVEDYPTKDLEEGEATLLRGMYEVLGMDTAPPHMWHIKPFPLPEPKSKK